MLFSLTVWFSIQITILTLIPTLFIEYILNDFILNSQNAKRLNIIMN